MDPSTFQMWVVSHMEKILEGQSALANALTKVAELTQREFQLLRYHSPSGGGRSTEASGTADASMTFHRLSRCLDEWKAFHNERELKAAALDPECFSSGSSDVGGEEDSYAETSTSRQSQPLQLNGHCFLEARSLQGVNDEEEPQMNEEEHRTQLVGHRIITRLSSARDLEEEKLRRKRERDKQRSAAYRIRKRAAKAGIPPPEFARLKINRRSLRNTQESRAAVESGARCVSSTGDTAEHSVMASTSSQAAHNEQTFEQETKPLLGVTMNFNQVAETQPKSCFTNLEV